MQKYQINTDSRKADVSNSNKKKQHAAGTRRANRRKRNLPQPFFAPRHLPLLQQQIEHAIAVERADRQQIQRGQRAVDKAEHRKRLCSDSMIANPGAET